MQHSDDLALARSLLSGDERQFNRFFEEYFPRLYRFAVSRMGEDPAVEDIVQTSMMNAIKALGSYRGEAAMFTWLCQICRNEINMHFRKLSKRVPEVAADDESIRPILELLESEAGENPDEQLESDETSRLVGEVLDFLPYSYGRALEWKYVLGLSVVEIAERLEITELAAQSLLARARTAFKNALIQLSPRLARAIQE